MNPYRVKAYSELLLVAIIWGVAGPIIKFTLGAVPPLLFLTYRFYFSTLAALIYFFLTRISFPKDKKTWVFLVVYGFLNSTVALGLLFFGLEKTSVVEMSLISLLGPLLTAVGGVIFLNEHVTKKEKIGMGIALAGTLFTVIEPLISNQNGEVNLLGNVLMVAYLLSGTSAAILAKKLIRKDLNPVMLAHFSFAIGFISLAPLALFKYGFANLISSFTTLAPIHIAGILFMALISGSLAYALGVKAQKTIEIGEAAVFSYLNPVIGIPIAILWLKETVSLYMGIGAVFIAIGVVIAESKRLKKTKAA